jgi:4-hydroxybenzoyl-CoA thioesterase
MSRTFSFPQKVLFKHCDPAGIVFYPRYFEMMNDCIEAFFSDALKSPWETLHIDAATPTVAIDTTFRSPSHHGDYLDIALAVLRVGNTSLGLRLHAQCNGHSRFEAAMTLVYVNRQGRPQQWPDTLRRALIQFLGDDT